MRPSAPPRTSHGVITCSRAAPVHSFIALPCQLSWRRVRSLNRRMQHACGSKAPARPTAAHVQAAAEAARRPSDSLPVPGLPCVPCPPVGRIGKQVGEDGWQLSVLGRACSRTWLHRRCSVLRPAQARALRELLVTARSCHCSLPARLVLGIRFCRGSLATCKVLSQLTGQAQHLTGETAFASQPIAFSEHQQRRAGLGWTRPTAASTPRPSSQLQRSWNVRRRPCARHKAAAWVPVMNAATCAVPSQSREAA